jgi:hypothetical protein
VDNFLNRIGGLIAATNPETSSSKESSVLGRIELFLRYLIFQIAQLPSDTGVVLSSNSAAFFTLALTFQTNSPSIDGVL